jgi:hypothetical protein
LKGKKFHPSNWQAPPGVMSCAGIRYWLKYLRSIGWGNHCLQRTCGFPRNQCHRKMNGSSWIYPKEQIRASYTIRRILAGELVQVKRGRRFDAVMAEHPVPVRVPPRLVYDIRVGRIEWFAAPQPGKGLPSFATLLDNPQTWERHDQV